MIKWGVRTSFRDGPSGQMVQVNVFGTVEGDVQTGAEGALQQQVTFAVKDAAARFDGSVLALAGAPGTFAPLVTKQLGAKLGKATVNVLGFTVSESDAARLKK